MRQFILVFMVLVPGLALGAGRKNSCHQFLKSVPKATPLEFSVRTKGAHTEILLLAGYRENEDLNKILAEADFIKSGDSIFDFYFDGGAGGYEKRNYTEPILNRIFFEFPDIKEIRTTLLGDDLDGFLAELSKNKTPAEALTVTPLARALTRRGFKEIEVVRFHTDDDDPMGTLHVDVAFKK